MKCLWLTREYPLPADSGEFLYSLGLIQSIAAKGVQVTVLCHGRDSEAAPGINGKSLFSNPETRANIKQVVIPQPRRQRARSLFSRLPADAFRLGNHAIRSALGKLLSREVFDVVVIDHCAMAWALEEFESPQVHPDNFTARLIYVSHNHEADTRRKVAETYEGVFPMPQVIRHDAAKYGRLERQLCERADLITAITADDEAKYRREWPKKEVLCLTPGHSGVAASAPAPALNEIEARNVVFAGSFEWLAKRMNLLRFLEAAAPIFKGENIHLRIVGKASSRFVRSVCRAHPWCEFYPNVDSITPFLRESRIGVIAEECGGGFKLKALDYLFHRVPIAALRSTVSGLPLSPGKDYLAADSLEELVTAIAENIGDLKRLEQLRDRAYSKCSLLFDWSDRGEALHDAIVQILPQAQEYDPYAVHSGIDTGTRAQIRTTAPALVLMQT